MHNMSRRAIAGMAACGLSALLSAPAGAQSTDPERQAVHVGPFAFRPRLAITNVGVDYNVFNERDNPKRDFTFVAAPDLEVSIQPGRLRLALTSGSEVVYFREYTSERSVNRSAPRILENFEDSLAEPLCDGSNHRLQSGGDRQAVRQAKLSRLDACGKFGLWLTAPLRIPAL